jgi:hydrogenase maturation protease
VASRAVIGVANPQRGDDAAGALVADRLAAVGQREFDVLHSAGDVAQLLDWLAAYDDVILVDAMAAQGAVKRLDARSGPLPALLSGASSHQLGLAHAVELARTLGRLPRRLIVYGIPGWDFSHGHSVTPGTEQAVRQVTALIRGEFLSVS